MKSLTPLDPLQNLTQNVGTSLSPSVIDIHLADPESPQDRLNLIAAQNIPKHKSVDSANLVFLVKICSENDAVSLDTAYIFSRNFSSKILRYHYQQIYALV